MAHIVLRQRPRISPNHLIDGLATDSQDLGVFCVDYARTLFIRRSSNGVARVSAREACHQHLSFGRTSSEQRRIPERADGVQPLPSWHQEPEAPGASAPPSRVNGQTTGNTWALPRPRGAANRVLARFFPAASPPRMP